MKKACLAFAVVLTPGFAVAAQPAQAAKAPAMTMQQVLDASQPGEWRALDPQNTVYMEIRGAGRVVIELAPAFAPNHVRDIKALMAEKFYDGLTINRVQDNYVTQWGDPDSDAPAKAKAVKAANANTKAEFERKAEGLTQWTALPDGDVYAPEVGFAFGMPAARDPQAKAAWLAHCYGMVGAGRNPDPDSGGGRELYVVIGHHPRQLDRNVTLFGRVIAGMELLSSLPRGTAPMGFYDKPEQRIPLTGMRLEADVAQGERTRYEVLRTDTATFAALVESRRNRREEWFSRAAGRIDLCNVPLPARRLQ
jgi:peptidylprolyl isomerase